LGGAGGGGSHLLNHSYNFYLVMFFVVWAVLSKMTNIQLPFSQGDQKVSVQLMITIQMLVAQRFLTTLYIPTLSLLAIVKFSIIILSMRYSLTF